MQSKSIQATFLLCSRLRVEQDLVEAYKWFNLAVAVNHTCAQRDKEILTIQMTPEAVAEGQRLSVEFKDEQ